MRWRQASPLVILRQIPPAQPAAQATPAPALVTMGQELDREMPILSKATPAAYFISYTLTSTQRAEVMGSNGALLSSEESRSRWLETQVRVGSYDLDNTHKVGNSPASESSFGTAVPVDDAPEVLRRAMWLQTDKQYRAASEALIKINTSKEVQSQTAEEHAPDFSREQPHVFYGPEVSIHLDRKPWEEKVRLYTARISRVAADPEFDRHVQRAEGKTSTRSTPKARACSLARSTTGWNCSSRARRRMAWTSTAITILTGRTLLTRRTTRPCSPKDRSSARSSKRWWPRRWSSPTRVPRFSPAAPPRCSSTKSSGTAPKASARKTSTKAKHSRGRSANRFFRVSFPSMTIRPRRRLGKDMLLGYYPFDDEGIPAERVTLVDHGVLRNFEMSRQPLTGFPHSNGHGRRQIGAQPVSRQGNLIVQSSLTVTNAELRKKLIEEIKRQGKSFGLMIDDIAGGFTFTGRGQPQAFQVQPLVVYKVYADGRPDELVRGVDIVGTPLVSLTKILATGDTMEVFNGYCGAESGSVPVAAAAPAILISEMEVQKKETSTDKPPILPPPAHDPEGARP